MPNKEILQKYADVLIKYALWGGKGLQPGEVVLLQIPESAKPMIIPLQSAVLEAGGHTIIDFIPEGIGANFFTKANEEQLAFHAKEMVLEKVKAITHRIYVKSHLNPKELEGVDSKKLMIRQKAGSFVSEAYRKKEDEGRLSWTLCLFGTEGMAKEAGMSLEQYWNQIIKACYLEEKDPVAKWKEVQKQVEETKKKLDDMRIASIYVQGEDVNLTIKIGENRKWLGGSGRNIPSFEIFISPDWRGTNGSIKFNQPLYRYGALIKGIELEFKDGMVVKSSATENEQLLMDMITTENADKIGEFSLTDKRFSRIDRFMADTLYDENFGGKYGNTHIALGNSYHDSYDGDIKSMEDTDWEKLGFNSSAVHTDIISTTNRKVTATLSDGRKKVIYEDGMFILD